MKRKLPSRNSNSVGSGQSPREIVFKTIADTTWRVFIPVAIFVSIGIWLDLALDTKPWITIIGLVVGLIFAGLLVAKQIKEL